MFCLFKKKQSKKGHLTPLRVLGLNRARVICFFLFVAVSKKRVRHVKFPDARNIKARFFFKNVPKGQLTLALNIA